jgi:hypothetical protein
LPARLLGQTILPPTNPTALPPPVSRSIPPPDLANSAVAPQIQFRAGKLRVIANGANLNSILREISRVTSIAIVGSVNDQRAYGTYGPATPGDVLDSLLDGTGTNMLLREPTASTPGKLILTPRAGGPTPPNLNADRDDYIPPVQPRPTYGRPLPYTRGPNPEPAPEPTPEPGPHSPATPNSELTPSQIYQQLQRIQQAQPQQHP